MRSTAIGLILAPAGRNQRRRRAMARVSIVHCQSESCSRTRFARPLLLHRLQQQCRNIEDLDVFAGRTFLLALRGSVVEHDVTEGTADGDLRCAGADSFVGAVQVDAFADCFFHPHACATGTAAEGLLGAAFHFDEFHAGD